MAVDPDAETIGLIHPKVYKLFQVHFGFPKFTEVQRASIKSILKLKDVVIQSPTGSGKTLAYVIPLFTLLLKNKEDWSKTGTVALILVPTRELVYQVSEVCRPFAEALNIKLGTCVGRTTKKSSGIVEDLGGSVVVATPGRLQVLLESEGVKKALKSLEFLVVDETDRFVEMGITESIAKVMEFIPKQRRTGLFSATQPKEMEELVSFCLRNPVFIDLTNEGDFSEESSKESLATPSSLQNYIAVINGEEKFCALIEFINANPEVKMLIFFSTCKCVAYMKKILKSQLNKRKLFSMHGKSRHGRTSVLDVFRKTSKSILLCTDVLSRGIDIPDIDWVVHFDIPKCSSWFVHRSGRSGRNGRVGKSLLFLSPEQTGYIQFLEKYEKVKLEEMEVPNCNAKKAEKLRNRLVKLASSDRDFLELGTGAFVSFICSYLRHDCNVVCPLDDLDVVGYAHSYGLLRIPSMKEFKNRDFSLFKRANVETWKIPFRNANKERERQTELLKRMEEKKALPRENHEGRIGRRKSIDAKKRKRKVESKSWEDLASDVALLKKFKKGRLSKEELSAALVC